MPRLRKKVAVMRNLPDAQAAPRGASYRNVRGKRGGLKDMPNMPLDVLLEIFCYLEPRDLLNLARTTKSFRKFLMNRGSANLWKAARANIEGLPDCLPRLSEPAYANLVFFSHCHNCLKPNIHTIYWEFGKRYCRSCAKTLTIAIFRELRGDVRYGWAAYYIWDHIFSVIRVDSRSEVYHCPELDKMKPIRERLRRSDEWGVFVQEQQAHVKAVEEHAALCRAWAAQRAIDRSEELEHIHQLRLNMILSKLRELGWDEELNIISARGYHPLRDHAQVRASKPLTDRAWTKIRDEIVAYMHEIKQTRLQVERRDIILRRLGVLRVVISAARTAPPKRTIEDEYKPKLQDLAMMPEVRELIEAPNDVVVDEQVITDAVVPMLPALEERWQQECRTELRAMLGNCIESQKESDVLNLARSVFRCKCPCRKYMHYPEVLAHEHRLGMHKSTEATEDEFLACVENYCRTRPWRVANFQVAPCIDQIDTVIAICGKDPETATQKDMDDADVRLVYGGPVLVAMTWRRAIKYMHQIDDFKVNCLNLATDDIKEAVVADEIKWMATALLPENSRRRWWCCGYCDVSLSMSRVNITRITSHLKNKHGVENPTVENGDMYLQPGSAPELPPIRIDMLESGNNAESSSSSEHDA